MPNHVRNVVKIKGIPKDKIDYVLNKFTKVVDYDRMIDFDLIIQEPRFKQDCPKNCIVNKYSHVMEDKERPWFDWYEWRRAYWGTKWNAYDGYTKIGKTQLTFVFSTAWCVPNKIYNFLFTWCYKQGYDLEIRYADENIGHNCGVITLDTSEHNLSHCHDSELTDPVRFANYI